MAFLPFYVPSNRPLQVVIVGGGYAGIAALISLYRHSPAAHVTLVDPGEAHVKVTHLHETFRRNLSSFRVPFQRIVERFDCRHLRASVEVSAENLREWQQNGGFVSGGEFIEFDYLLIANGASAVLPDPAEGVYDLRDFMAADGTELIGRVQGSADPWLTVVGAGATGVQFLFEIAHHVRSHRLPFRIRMVDGEDSALKQFAPALGRYAQARMADAGIEFRPRTFYRGQESGKLALQDRETGESFAVDSCASFVFSGKAPECRLKTTLFGQVIVEGQTLSRIFAAGDCADYRGFGSNALTAQAAVRKGKLAARNILRSSGRLKVLEPYLHRDLGYVVSLGPDDAIGWLALEGNIVAGAPALVVKELVEAQYDLLLAGIDTYLI